MVIESIIGNVDSICLSGKEVDKVVIDWFETNKKILKKTTGNGTEIGIRINHGFPIKEGDILWMDEEKAIVVEIAESDCISLTPHDMDEMGTVCYEIGNKHAPLFIAHGEILTPYEEPLFVLLQKSGFRPQKKRAKLVKAIGGHAHEHGHAHSH